MHARVRRSSNIGGPIFFLSANLFTSCIAIHCRCLLSTVISEFSGDHKNSNMKLGYSLFWFGWHMLIVVEWCAYQASEQAGSQAGSSRSRPLTLLDSLVYSKFHIQIHIRRWRRRQKRIHATISYSAPLDNIYQNVRRNIRMIERKRERKKEKRKIKCCVLRFVSVCPKTTRQAVRCGLGSWHVCVRAIITKIDHLTCFRLD